jgi:hypothetical protein
MKIRIDPLDALFSLYVRARAGWKCERCGKYYPEGERQGLDCSHFMGRANKGTRWAEDNAAAHCRGCHQYLGANPILFVDWIINHIGGQRYAALRAKASKPTKWTPFDREMIAWEFYEKLEKIESGETLDKARKYAASVAKKTKKGKTTRPAKIMARPAC